MLKKIIAVLLVLSLTMTLAVSTPNAEQSSSAEAACNGCAENVVSATQLQLLLAAENNAAIGHVITSPVFQALQGRVLPNTQFSVAPMVDGTSVVSFEVLPANHNDAGVSSFLLELAIFVVQNNAVVAANVNSRVVGDNHLFYQRDLFSQVTVAIRTAEPMPNLSLPPQEILPMPPVADPYYVSPGCWVCMEMVYVPGTHDGWCLYVGGGACAVAALAASLAGPAGAAALAACLSAVAVACWIPSRSYCVRREFFNNCPMEFPRRDDAV